MQTIRVNRLPLLTYRYLHTNDSPFAFEAPRAADRISFSDSTYVAEGGTLPEHYDGASAETVAAAAAGARYAITIPAGVETALTVSLDGTAGAAQFVVHLEEGAKLALVWKLSGGDDAGNSVIAVDYTLDKGAQLTVSRVVEGLSHCHIYDQRNAHLAEKAKAHFISAEIGGENVIVHSYGKLAGDKSEMTEHAIYASRGSQKLDLFYHIDHVGKKTKAEIDVKGALADTSKKIFRATLDFKRGCSGSIGDEGDYAIQLDPKTHNISLPLLLCTEDDVQGNHASSSGQLDQNTIYFLMSRGFSYEEARRIVVEALIRPIIDKMDGSVRDEVIAAVREKLDRK